MTTQPNDGGLDVTDQIQDLQQAARQGDGNAAISLLLESWQRRDVRLWEISVAGLLLCPDENHKAKEIVRRAIGVRMSPGNMWEHYGVWKSIADSVSEQSQVAATI